MLVGREVRCPIGDKPPPRDGLDMVKVRKSDRLIKQARLINKAGRGKAR